VPEEINEWLHHPITDIYARYPSRPTPSCRGEPEERDGSTDWHASALQDFVKRHDTSQGYGGWKQAYRRFVFVPLPNPLLLLFLLLLLLLLLSTGMM
jgi:hypothetical protein